MLASMRRITVTISDKLDTRLRHEAERRGMAISELMREALELYVSGAKRRKLLAKDAGSSGRDDVSVRIEEILASESAR
jgi:predicted transcriptional regulator